MLRWIIFPLFLIFSFSSVSKAQQCEIIPDQIVSLKFPSFEGLYEWSVLYGEDGFDRFSKVIMFDKELFFAAGDYTRDSADNKIKPFFAAFNRRGTVAFETKIESAPHKSFNSFLKEGEAYVFFGDIRRESKGNGIHISHYKQDGTLLREKEIFEPGVNLDARKILKSHDGKNFIILAQYENKKDKSDRYGLVMKVSPRGNILWRRAFQPGIETVFHGIEKVKDENYLITGQMRQQDGRMAGWLVRVNDEGSIGWQRIYPRGGASKLLSSVMLKDGGYVVTGQSSPLDGGKDSAWVMKVDAVGNMIWQRFFIHSRFNYAAPDSLFWEDGRISVLLDGNAVSLTDSSHVRVMTLSPRGVILDLVDLREGIHSHAKYLGRDDEGKMMIAGHAQVKMSQDLSLTSDMAEKLALGTFDGWATGLPALPDYVDPCAPIQFSR